MKIGIDARFLTHPQLGGFKTYTENLISALGEVDAQNEYILYVDRPLSPKTVAPHKKNFRVCVVPGTWRVVGMPLREQWGLPRQVKRDRVDLLHSLCLTAPLNLDCHLVVTIHDMIWRFPEKFAQGKKLTGPRKWMEWYYRFVAERAVRQAAAVITVSHSAEADIHQHFNGAAKHVAVTYEAASPLYRRVKPDSIAEKLRNKFNLPRQYILAIGSADPRKNMTGLLQAYAALPSILRAQFPLVIVWTHQLLSAAMMAVSEQLGIAADLRFLQAVSDEDLLMLYNSAALFVFPSLYEGFGLPLLEAMACGTPVVTTGNSSIPEIVGDAGVVAPVNNPQGLKDAMSQVLSDPALRVQLAERGLARATAFSWARCARETIAVYKQVVC